MTDVHEVPPSARALDLRSYLLMVRRRWWLIAVVLGVVLATTIFATLRQQKVYQGEVRLFVGQQSIRGSDIQFAQTLTQTSLALVFSYAEAIQTRPIAAAVVTKLDLPYGADTVLDNMSSRTVTNTQIIKLTYRDTDRGRARNVANAIANTFIEGLARINPSGGGKPAVSVSVLEPAVKPTHPVSPKPVRDTATGLFLGLLLAGGAVMLAERLDLTVKGRVGVEDASGLPALAIVPHIKTPRGSLVNPAGTPAGEAYRTLRTAVQYAAEDRRVKVIAVTSPEAADGKTSTAFNLAVAFAEAGLDAYVVEADMRNPSMAKNLQLPAKVGLSNCLAGQVPLERIILRASQPHLYLVPAGPRTDRAPELFSGDRMSAVLDELRTRARIVIVDTPPVLGVSDPVALASTVDGYLLVVRSGKTRAEHLRESVRVLAGVGATIFGTVVNDLSRSGGLGYGYGYGYGYGAYGYRPSGRPSNGQVGGMPAVGFSAESAVRRPRSAEVSKVVAGQNDLDEDLDRIAQERHVSRTNGEPTVRHQGGQQQSRRRSETPRDGAPATTSRKRKRTTGSGAGERGTAARSMTPWADHRRASETRETGDPDDPKALPTTSEGDSAGPAGGGSG